jgi:hypothetical protein
VRARGARRKHLPPADADYHEQHAERIGAHERVKPIRTAINRTSRNAKDLPEDQADATPHSHG